MAGEVAPTAAGGATVEMPVARNGIFHIHPSLRCNLACAHCYSSSAPGERDRLDPDSIARAVDDAADLGFGVVSISGGEPLLYRGLDRMLAAARANGQKTQIVTNGWFCDSPRFDKVEVLVDLVAISLDGPADHHRAMRGTADAFARFERATASLKARGRRFGVVHTVTEGNWELLFETARIAAENGAALFQIHALEAAGRAMGRTDAPDAALLARIFIVAALLRGIHGAAMAIHVDLEHRDHRAVICNGADPAQAIGILVLEADGTLVPMSYGFDRRFALGNIREKSLSQRWEEWQAGSGYRAFLGLRRMLEATLDERDAPDVFNRFERMHALAHAVPRLATDGALAA